ncbi:MAG: transposase [Chloroflexota bacterium]
MNIRRYYVPGAAVFITQVVESRLPVFHDPETVSLLRSTLHRVQGLHSFTMLGYVFLPDHFHMIIQPTGKSNFSQIMQSLKTNFTKSYKVMKGIPPSESTKFWQKRFWDHIIRNDRDLENHLHYIHFNPAKHGWIAQPRDWQDSSYLEWERRGLYAAPFVWDEPRNSLWGE